MARLLQVDGGGGERVHLRLRAYKDAEKLAETKLVARMADVKAAAPLAAAPSVPVIVHALPALPTATAPPTAAAPAPPSGQGASRIAALEGRLAAAESLLAASQSALSNGHQIIREQIQTAFERLHLGMDRLVDRVERVEGESRMLCAEVAETRRNAISRLDTGAVETSRLKARIEEIREAAATDLAAHGDRLDEIDDAIARLVNLACGDGD